MKSMTMYRMNKKKIEIENADINKSFSSIYLHYSRYHIIKIGNCIIV